MTRLGASALADISYAFRTFRRAPLATVTIIATVALGLAAVTLVFTVYNTLFLRADAVRRPGELFAVERPTRPGARSWYPFTRPEYEALRRETSVFTDAAAMLRGIGRASTAVPSAACSSPATSSTCSARTRRWAAR